VPDAIYGEEVVSYVVARPGAELQAEDLFRAIAPECSQLSRRRNAIVLADALPKTERGKLDRKALADLWKRSSPG